MTLLTYAAPYDTNGGEISEDTYLPQQRRTGGGGSGGKTIKKRPAGQPVERKRCVEALMQMTSNDSDDEDGNGLADFRPPAKPELTRVPNAIGQQASQPQQAQPQPQNMLQQNSEPSSYSDAHSPPHNLRADISGALAAIQNSNNASYYQVSPSSQAIGTADTTKSINEQLNYIIHLLEEQQNAKTSTTTEELILYTFLGVFTIYIVDSFTKVGKAYTR